MCDPKSLLCMIAVASKHVFLIPPCLMTLKELLVTVVNEFLYAPTCYHQNTLVRNIVLASAIELDISLVSIKMRAIGFWERKRQLPIEDF